MINCIFDFMKRNKRIYMINRNCKWLLVLAIAIFSISCAPTRQAAYFRTYNESKNVNTPDRTYYIKTPNVDLIQPGDQLFINVVSGNDEPNIFNQSTVQAVTDIELINYEVDNEGFVDLPYLNRIKLAGYTVNQAIDTLETQLSQYLFMPDVKVKFANSRVTVLGEVNNPGVYVFNRKTINIFQAVAYAGDISTFGNRKKVSVIRHDGSNIIKKKIDLTNDEIFTSNWYYMKPNDIIYVEPLGRKMWGMETFDYSIIFSILSSIISLYTLSNLR